MLIVFDCDGTLVDSQANIVTAMAQAFSAHELPEPDHHAVRRVVGLSLPEAMARLLPAESQDQQLAIAGTYKSIYGELRLNGTLADEPLYDGISALIEALRAGGHLLGVATGKSDRGLRHVLDHHGLMSQFITLQTADRHPSKPDPAMLLAAMAEAGAQPGETIMLGDTDFDMLMAANAGTHAIGVDWGYHDVADLQAAGARTVLRHPDELLHVIAGLGGAA